MCQQCQEFLKNVMTFNHNIMAICELINNEPWYHKTREDNVNNIKQEGLKLGREICSSGNWNSCYGDGISLCKSDCWSLASSGNHLFKVKLKILNPLYDVYWQTPFNKKYPTQTRFYQNDNIVSGYLDGASKNLNANIERTDKMLTAGFDSVLFEESNYAVLVYLKEISPSELTYLGQEF